MPHIEIPSIIVASALAAFAALTAALIPDTQTTTTSHSPVVSTVNVIQPAESITVSVNIMDDSKLRLICIAGAVGGAILSVGLFPPRETNDNKKFTREFAAKFISSTVAGVIFSPMLTRWVGSWLGVGTGTDVVLMTGGLVALMSWGVLQMIVPIMTRFTVASTRAKFPVDND